MRTYYPEIVLDRMERQTDDPAALMEIQRIRENGGWSV